MSTRDELATIILDGILHHMPNIEPRALELILSRTAQLHRDRYERQQAEAIGHVQEQARAESLAQIEEKQKARNAAAAQREATKEAKHQERLANLRAAIAAKPGIGHIRTRKKRFPNLVDEIGELLKTEPQIKPGAARHRFEETYGKDFISYPGWKNYWREAHMAGVE